MNQNTVLFGQKWPFIWEWRLTDNDKNETWLWDGVKWDKVLSNIPPRIQQCMVFDSIRNLVVMFGGYVYFDITWNWNGNIWSKVEGKVPPHGRYSDMAFDKVRGESVLFGGENGGILENRQTDAGTWTFDGKEWKLAAVSPPNDYLYDLVYDDNNQNTILFGGDLGFSEFGLQEISKTYTWNGIKWNVHNTTSNQPDFRFEHKMVYDSVTKGVWLFGGYNGNLLNDFWFWNREEWNEIIKPGPSPRSGHAMAYDPNRNVLVLFGGYAGGFGIVKSNNRVHPNQFDYFPNDTWEWDGNEWNQVDTDGPEYRRFSKLIYDPERQKILLFGGSYYWGYPEGTGKEYQDIWAWDGIEWHELHIENTPLMSGSNVFYIPERESIVMIGNPVESQWSMWELKNNIWKPLKTDKPIDFYMHNSVTYDTHRNKLVGFFGDALGTWELDVSELEPAESSIDSWKTLD